MGLGAVACWQGVRSIERANRVLVPTLLVIVVIAVVRALTLPGAGAGLAYLFTPEWSQLAQPRIWLEALTQNAWDTGAGWGLILTYAAYMRKEHGVVRNAVPHRRRQQHGLAPVGDDDLRDRLRRARRRDEPAGDAGGDADERAGLDGADVHLDAAALRADGRSGKPLAVLFFLALSFAALSSLISMIELASRALVDFGLPRRRAVATVAGVGFVLGVPSALEPDVLRATRTSCGAWR